MICVSVCHYILHYKLPNCVSFVLKVVCDININYVPINNNLYAFGLDVTVYSLLSSFLCFLVKHSLLLSITKVAEVAFVLNINLRQVVRASF